MSEDIVAWLREQARIAIGRAAYVDPIAHHLRAAAMVSKRDPVNGSSTISIVHSPWGPFRSRPSAARSAKRCRSGISKMRVAPDSAAATIARRTMPTFVTSEVWVAGVTNRRMSLPALGLTMIPTVAMGTIRRGP